MKYHIQLHVIFLLIGIIVLTACGGGTKPPGIVPDDLQTIEAAAEDIIDFAPGGNWEKINADVTEIANAWRSYQIRADKDGVAQNLQNAMMAAIERLKTAAATKDAVATMQGSNDVSAAVVEMYALYNPTIPADIGRLDVLERQVILNVEAKDYTAAETSLTKIESVWVVVKPSVLEHEGKDVASKFEASLAGQVSALVGKDVTAVIGEVGNALEVVDEMEQLY